MEGELNYAEAVNVGLNEVKPLFVKEIDFFGVKNPPRDQWMVNTELYKTIAEFVPMDHLVGLQRITGGLWRIYLDNLDSRSQLLTCDFTFRGKSMPIYNQNPNFRYVNASQMDPTVRVRIQNVPLSADNGQIKRALELRKCDIKSFFREKLRVDGRLTNCETGDRIAIISIPETPLPIFMEIGKYRAKVYHRGQYNERLNCNKCLQKGHSTRDCTNDVVCRSCNNPGHIMADCPDKWATEDLPLSSDLTESEDGDGDDESDSVEESDHVNAALHPSSTSATTATNVEHLIKSVSKTATQKSKTPSPKKKKLKAKKPKKGLSQTTSAKPGSLEGYIVINSARGTPNRKSNALPATSRSPITPVEEKEAKERQYKRSKENP